MKLKYAQDVIKTHNKRKSSAIKTKTPEQLKAWRLKNGKSQTDLAVIMGYKKKSYQKITSYELGYGKINDITHWEKLISWCKVNKVKYEVKA